MIESRNRAEGIWKLTNGSQISFKSCDSGWEKFQGAGIDWIWFDEEPPEPIYKECLLRILASQMGWIWGTMTPLKGFTWVYKKLYKPWKDKTRDDLEIFEFDIWENEFLNKDQIEQIAKDLSGPERQARLKGQFTDLIGGQIFRREWFKPMPDKEDLPKIQEIYVGVDPSASKDERGDRSALVSIGVGSDRKLYVIDVRAGHWSTEELTENMAMVIQRFNPTKVLLETVSGFKMLGDYWRQRFPFLSLETVKPDKDKARRALSVSHLCENGIVHVSHEELLEELVVFSGQKGQSDDLTDAFVWALKLCQQYANPERKSNNSWEQMRKVDERSYAMWDQWPTASKRMALARGDQIQDYVNPFDILQGW